MIIGRIDHTYITQQRDIFSSGLVAEIGPNAFTVWLTIKYFANYKTGQACPGMRKIGKEIGVSKDTVSRAVEILKEKHLIKVVDHSKFKRKGQTYVARERLEIHTGNQVLCTVVIDYIPSTLRTTIGRITKLLEFGEDDPLIWKDLEVIASPGFTWDPFSKAIKEDVAICRADSDNSDKKTQNCKNQGREFLEKIRSELKMRTID